MEEILAVALGYLVGSVPFAFLLARRRGVDLRRAGSGNVGAANVLRTTGLMAAVLALGLDAGKGAVAVLAARWLTEGPATPVAAGLAAVIGHIYPAWLRFRGGKGVATAAGVFAVLAPTALAIAGGVFVVVVWVSRYISAGSMAGAISLAAASGATNVAPAVTVGAAISALIIVHGHRANVARLVAGSERRVGQRL